MSRTRSVFRLLSCLTALSLTAGCESFDSVSGPGAPDESSDLGLNPSNGSTDAGRFIAPPEMAPNDGDLVATEPSPLPRERHYVVSGPVRATSDGSRRAATPILGRESGGPIAADPRSWRKPTPDFPYPPEDGEYISRSERPHRTEPAPVDDTFEPETARGYNPPDHDHRYRGVIEGTGVPVNYRVDMRNLALGHENGNVTIAGTALELEARELDPRARYQLQYHDGEGSIYKLELEVEHNGMARRKWEVPRIDSESARLVQVIEWKNDNGTWSESVVLESKIDEDPAELVVAEMQLG